MTFTMFVVSAEADAPVVLLVARAIRMFVPEATFVHRNWYGGALVSPSLVAPLKNSILVMAPPVLVAQSKMFVGEMTNNCPLVGVTQETMGGWLVVSRQTDWEMAV